MYHLLIVDDEVNIADGLALMFRESQLPLTRVETAYTGSQALEYCRKGPVDIVLSDIRMPGMNGLELLNSVRDNWQHVIFIFLTGYAEFDYAKRALQGHAHNYLLKPAEDEEVLAAVEKAIAAHEKEMKLVRTSVSKTLETPKRVTDDSFLQGIQTYIAANLDKDLSLESLAGRFYVNPSYLSRIFHQQSGEQLSHYIERTKMTTARELLEDPRYKVYEIAVRVGYSNPNYFAKVFRKNFGLSPNEFRFGLGIEQG
jgi:two-component system response regulator YesN